MIHILLNGERKALQSSMTVEELLRQHAIPRERVVVEQNMRILSKEELASTLIQEGDTLEIVQFVGGGSQEAKALVIVESPAKCKTINKYLGSRFEVTASMGHVIDLPKSKMGIDFEHNFEPQYVVSRDKKKILADLKKKAKGKKEIFLACDPDREGEAISWHLKNQLGEGKSVYRVVFNEITKDAVLEAFKHPMEINMNLVGAQQARRVLDRLVGYNLSPLLWQKVGRGLSAGRVQSVALRLIVDQERKIQAFISEEYWTVQAHLKKHQGDPRPFVAKLEKIEQVKAELKNDAQAMAVADKCQKGHFVVKEVKRQKKKRNPTAPFTTSKLQQAAYNQLKFPASKTMRVAQSLYEGVDIGEEGSLGLITYMRTDSVRVSDGAMKETRDFIAKEYGQNYLPQTPNVYKAKKAAQEAHEAIRPTSVLRRPVDVGRFLTPDQFKLYLLIWEQMVSSQMTPAIISQDTVDIGVGHFLFRATGSHVEFAGFLTVTGKNEEQDNPLPPMTAGEKLELLQLEKSQHFTKPPARFTDASLVKVLEEKGIGRPSTYAPIIMTLTERHYVRRDGGSLIPSELGMLVTDLLVGAFKQLLDYEFTANMELELDRVEEGQFDWTKPLKDFYGEFEGQLSQAQKDIQTVKRVAEPTNESCEKCGKPMVIKWGRRGRFMSCSGWPECKNAKPISTDVECPTCKTGKLVARRARSGKGRQFYGCTRYPECHFISNRLPSAEAKTAPAPEEAPEAPSEGANG